MTKPEMLAFWDELWNKSMWYPAIGQSFAGLTAQQATWKPQPGRNSIWQHLNHLTFWREVTVNRKRGIKQPPADVIANKNFEEPTDTSDQAWREAVQSFERSQKLIHDAIADGSLTMDEVKMMVPHDAYHVGQVMLLRALQGLPPTTYE